MNCSDCNNINNINTTTLSVEDTAFLKKVNIACAVLLIVCSLIIVASNSFLMASILAFSRLRHHVNYLLFSLAIADLVVGLVVCPLYAAIYLEMETLYYNRHLCIAATSLTLMSCGSSLCNLAVIVTDRYIAIFYPFAYIRYKSIRLQTAILFVLWVYAIAHGCYPLVGSETDAVNESKRCRFENVIPKGYLLYLLVMAVFYVLLCVVMYARIFGMVGKRRRRLVCVVQNFVEGKPRIVLDRRRSIVHDLVIFLLFLIFWVPYLVVSPVARSTMSPETVDAIMSGLRVLMFANSFVNPIVYAFIRIDFRMALRVLLSTSIKLWPSVFFHKLDDSSLSFYPHNGVRSRSCTLTPLSIETTGSIQLGVAPTGVN